MPTRVQPTPLRSRRVAQCGPWLGRLGSHERVEVEYRNGLDRLSQGGYPPTRSPP
jgi:hypothetical protein